MLLIRPAVRTGVHLLKTLIHEMGEYERLPVLITEETLAHDGFGPRQEFRVLIADWDSESVEKLRDQRIICSARGERVRVSLAPYNDASDVMKLFQALAGFHSA